MLLPEFNDKDSNTFLNQCMSLKTDFHSELSIKLTPEKVIDKRVLFGFEKANMTIAEWTAFLAQLQPSTELLQLFLQHAKDANAFLFGIEEQASKTTLKIYLEYWEQLVELIQQGKIAKQPFPLNRGFKWNPNAPQDWVEDVYWCYPMLETREIKGRIKQLLDHHHSRLDAFISSALLSRDNVSGEQLIYLEIEESTHQRRSFDINCYKANLKLQHLVPALLELCHRWKIEPLARPLLTSFSSHPLGHISGGIDRNGEPFLTLYIEN